MGGLLDFQAQNYDVFVADGLTNFLFAQPGGSFGGDLIARNIQVISGREIILSRIIWWLIMLHFREAEIMDYRHLMHSVNTASFHLSISVQPHVIWCQVLGMS